MRLGLLLAISTLVMTIGCANFSNYDDEVSSTRATTGHMIYISASTKPPEVPLNDTLTPSDNNFISEQKHHPFFDKSIASKKNETDRIAKKSSDSDLDKNTIDLWERIRRGFAMPDLDNDIVRDRELWYASQPDYLERMSLRASRYLFHIVEEIEQRGMPTELALLPFVESAFNPQAVSSVRAMGMWQFMPATGVRFDLQQNMFQDERRDVLASTRAALDYLQLLYDMFGDWHLALASYNWGEGRVTKAVANNVKNNLPAGYADLRMPKETRYYVPKLQAIKNIVARGAYLGVELPIIGNHPYFQAVDILHDIDVITAAQLAGISMEEFRALNPSVRGPIIFASTISQILLPWDNAAIFNHNLKEQSTGNLASWGIWTLPSTMSTAKIASAVGMKETEFRSINGIAPRMLVRSGSTVIVRRSSRMKDVSAHQIAHAYLRVTPEVRKIVIRAGKRDSIASIAKRYRLSPSLVAKWNKTTVKAKFKPGANITLHLPVTRSVANKTQKKKTAVKGSNKTVTKNNIEFIVFA